MPELKSLSTRRTNPFVALAVIIAVTAVGVAVVASSQAATGGFVTRVGSGLQLDGKPFRFAGANIYWLGLDENVGGVDYPTHGRIDAALTDAKSMNATVVRSHTLGISVGCSKCIEPALGQFNDAAFESIDYSIKTARDKNIKLVIPLVDQWNFYHGGKSTFLAWRGLAQKTDDRNAKSNLFHTDLTVRQDYKDYITHVLNHKNQYTGIALKDDPTIMMWQTGNELFTWDGNWSQAWTHDIAAHIKSLAPNQMVGDGRVANEEHPFTEAQYADQLAEPAIDMVDIHHYPMRTQLMLDSVNAAKAKNKAVMVGEFAWPGNGGDPLAGYLGAIENSKADGDLYWSLFPNGVNHDDGYTLHYPGDNAGMKTAVTALSTHAARMAGLQTIPPTPTPEPSVSVVPVTGNLLSNASFETDATKNGNMQTLFDPWWFEIKSGASATIARDTGTKADGAASARVDIASSDAHYKVQLYQHLATTAGTTYQLAFYAKAAANKPVHVVMQQAASPNTVYLDATVNITPAWQRYVVTYKAAVSQADTLFVLNLGASTDTTWIDAASVTAGGSTATPAPTATPVATATPTRTPTPTIAGTPTTTPVATSKGDINKDGRVNILDLSSLLSGWGKSGATDLNSDGTTNILDLSILLSSWTR